MNRNNNRINGKYSSYRVIEDGITTERPEPPKTIKQSQSVQSEAKDSRTSNSEERLNDDSN